MRPKCVSYHLNLYKFIRTLGTYFKFTNKLLFIFVARTIRNHRHTNADHKCRNKPYSGLYTYIHTCDIVCKYDVQMKQQHSVDTYLVNYAYGTTVLPRCTLVSSHNLNTNPTINLTKYNVDCI